MNKPIACKINTSKETQDNIKSYGEVAKSIGFNPLAYQYESLMFFMQMNDIPVYDYEKVSLYLESKLTKGKHWQWTPLRECDMEANASCTWHGSHVSKKYGLIYDEYLHNGMIFPKQLYNDLVPAKILLQVGAIAKEFSQARFYVSEISEYKDPFICCSFENFRSGNDPKRIIFGMWDEPGF